VSENRQEPKRAIFDPTINLGHVLTFIGMMGVVYTGWATLDRRITVVEERQNNVIESSASRAAEYREAIKEIRLDIKEVRTVVNELARRPSK
jgi:hypothetical protein